MRVLVGVIFIFSALFGGAGPSKEVGEAVKAKLDSNVFQLVVIREDGRMSGGTGFSISEQGLVMTADHVILGASKIFMEVPIDLIPEKNRKPGLDTMYVEAKVVHHGDPDLDVAILVVPIMLPDKLEFAKGVNKGEFIWIMGFPGNRDCKTINWGTAVSEFTTDDIKSVKDDSLYGEGTIPAYYGFSGSPVVNAEGKVIGVCSRVDVDSEYKDMFRTLYFVNLPAIKMFLTRAANSATIGV